MMEVAQEWDIFLFSHLCWEVHMCSTNQADMEAPDNVMVVTYTFTSITLSNLAQTEQCWSLAWVLPINTLDFHDK